MVFEKEQFLKHFLYSIKGNFQFEHHLAIRAKLRSKYL